MSHPATPPQPTTDSQQPTAPTCRHLHTDGRPCGSPALRGQPFCYHHHAARKPMPQRATPGQPLFAPQLPAPDDFLAIQRSIGEVLRLLALDRLEDRRAATLLRGLAIASQNLARHHRREEKLAAHAAATGIPIPKPVTEFVNHPTHGTLAPEADALNQQPGTNTQQPTPEPIPLLTPDPTRSTAYDEALLVEMRRDAEVRFAERAAAFEHRKSLELEDLYDQRMEEVLDIYKHRLEQHLADQETQLRRELQTPIPIPIQQNQDLTANPEKNHTLAWAG